LAQLPNSRLNCVFEVPDIEYPARPVHEAPDSAKASKKRKLEVVEKPRAGKLEAASREKKISMRNKKT
jgi:hypothetical protein